MVESMHVSPTTWLYYLRQYFRQRQVILLVRFFGVFVLFVAAYSVLFHVFMAREGYTYSWVTGLYWTITVMSTLGLGDITFTSDVGRVFTLLVLLSGVVFLLVLLPLVFMQGQSAARVLRELPKDTRGHVILTQYDAVTSAVISRLTQYRSRYVLLVPELAEALRLHDLGLQVVMGELDHPDTFQKVRTDQAAGVVTTASDALNTNVAFTVRDVAPMVPLIATANDPVAGDMLKLAGCSHVLHLGDMLGQSLARRILGGDAVTHVIGQFDQLLIAEATAARTPLVGTTLRQSQLREQVGVSVIGVWDRGHFAMARPETPITPHTVLVLAGSQQQLQQYDTYFCVYNVVKAPVVVLGGGRVGRATGRALAERNMGYRIIEQLPERIQDPEKYILGNAADGEILRQAGLMDAPAVVITTHDDDVNIYLTLYCRHLRPEMQIISRATLERNVATLHRAGADFVMSYASMGANTMVNLLRRGSILMVTEGLDVFKVPVPRALVGKTLTNLGLRRLIGCNVIALTAEGTMQINPDPSTPLPAHADLILIGTTEAEKRFLQRYGTA
jgi:voltage-gated potassium channel